MGLTIKKFKEIGLYDKILNSSGEGLNVVDIEGKLVYVNKVSVDYAEVTLEEMIGQPIEKFYPKAVLLGVLKDQHAIINQKIHYVGKKRYVVSSYPIYDGDEFVGAYSIFKDIQEMDELNKRVKLLELQVRLNRPVVKISNVIDEEGLLEPIFQKAKRAMGALGGPRHSLIVGEQGAGKTMLATLMYNYAKKIGVIAPNAPFIEVNCMQFSSADMAGIEIFGSEDEAYGSSKRRKGLFEQASGGILFLEEAYALENYQASLLKALESGRIRRIGGGADVTTNAIVIVSSTKPPQEVLLPELYQRLAQYEMRLPSLSVRSPAEKNALFDHFVLQYKETVEQLHKIKCNIIFTPKAKNILVNAKYKRNIGQFRDMIHYSIDVSSPLTEEIGNQEEITTIVDVDSIPFSIIEGEELEQTNLYSHYEKASPYITDTDARLIMQLHKQGLGARKIARVLQEEGRDIPYYKVNYYISKNAK